MNSLTLDRYGEAMAEQGRRPGNVRFNMETLYDRIPLEGRTVIDIGAGEGEASLYAAVRGAKRVVALEPEADGSSSNMQLAFERARDHLGADQVELRGETLQGFDPAGDVFDVLVLTASINHLDERACVDLHRDEVARQTYLELLGQLTSLAAPGAHLVVTDCSRHNFFQRMGMRNPVAPTIEWEKHQPPTFWAGLLQEVGWRQPRIRWTTFSTFRRPGQALLGNRFCAYFGTSSFCLTMTRQ